MKATSGPVPGSPAGGWGGRSAPASGSEPKTSVCSRSGATPAVSSAGGEVAHPRRRAAQEPVRGERDAEVLHHLRGHPARGVEVPARQVGRRRAAEADVRPRARQGREVAADLVGERVLRAVAGAVDPPDLALVTRRGEAREHGEHRRRADAGAEEGDRPRRPRVERERPARGADLEHVAGRGAVVQVRAHRAAGLALDAEPVAVRVRRGREREAAQQRPRRPGGSHAHGQELPGAEGRQAAAVDRLELERGDRRRLAA